MHAVTVPKWAKPQDRRARYATFGVFGLIALFACLKVLFKPKEPGWRGTYSPLPQIEAVGKHGAVASDDELCSQMGVDVLSQGGTAADAAVTVALCIGSTQPQSSGIGGGGFITVRLPNGTAFFIDCRETAPLGSHKHMFDEDPNAAKAGGRASGVPGELAGLSELHKLAGKWDWKTLVEPVAELNQYGFERNEGVNHAIRVYEQQAPKNTLSKMIALSHWCWLFGDRKQCGQRPNGTYIQRPELARTLQLIADEGISAFYNGTIADSLVEFSSRFGGILSKQDFQQYKAIVRPAHHGKFRNRDVYTGGAPSSGPALLMALNAVDLATNFTSETDAGSGQQLVEIMKWMAAARTELGDPEFASNPAMETMINLDWARNVVGNISLTHTLPSWRDYHPSYEMVDPKGTTHFSVVDENGMAVSMTSTVNLPFGNLMCDPETGIIMNSEMDDFSVPFTNNSFELSPSAYNFIEPGKRPLSSAVPVVVVNNETGLVETVAGASGGSRILTSVFLALTRIYAFNNTALEAVCYPRFHHQLMPETLMVEPGVHAGNLREWEMCGHTLERREPGSGLNIVNFENGHWHAVGDFYRKRGLGSAY